MNRRPKDTHQPDRIGVRKRTQHIGVQHAEHRGIRADTESQRRYGDERKGWRATEGAPCVPRVLNEVPPPSPASRIAILFPGLRKAARGVSGLTKRIGGGQTAFDVRLRL